MQRRFIYFINPISGTKNKLPLIELIKTETTNQQIPFEILDTTIDGNYSFLSNKIEAEKITDVIICGGDGTVNQIISFLLGVPVNVGIIPMGSGNGLALAAGLSRNAKKALKIIFNGNVKNTDGFFVNGKFGCMLTGLGFDAQVAFDFLKQKKRGLFTYIKICFKNFFIGKHYLFEVEINKQRINTDAFFISVANSNQFGNHVTIAPKASLSDGLLDIIIITKMNKFLTVFSLLRQISLGKIQPHHELFNKNKNIYYFQTDELIIHNTNMAPLHIDGEPAETNSTIEIKVLPSAFKLLQPL